MRTCVGCRQARPATELVRVVATADGRLVVDRHAPGRGAWLCRGSTACLERAGRRKAFERALRTTLAPGAGAALTDAIAESLADWPPAGSSAGGSPLPTKG